MIRPYKDRLDLARRRSDRYPLMAMAPVGNPTSESVKNDKTFGSAVIVPFNGPGETGWTAWFFESEALHRAFIRRFAHARPLKDLRLVTDRRPGPYDDDE